MKTKTRGNIMYSGGDGEVTLKPPNTPFKGDKKGTADMSYLSGPKAPSSQAHTHPLAAPPQNENAAGVFLEKLHLASLGTETVRSFERAWGRGGIYQKGIVHQSRTRDTWFRDEHKRRNEDQDAKWLRINREMWQIISRESINTLEGKPGLLQNMRKAELISQHLAGTR